MKPQTKLLLIREALNLTQVQMSNFLQLKQSNYSNLEKGVAGRRLNDKIVELTEINLKVNRTYLVHDVGRMFTTDQPLYSDRLKITAAELNVSIDKLSAALKPDLKRMLQDVINNNATPSYELYKQLFKDYQRVNIDYLLDAIGKPVMPSGDEEKQYYQQRENMDALTIFREAVQEYKKINAEKDAMIERLKGEVLSLKERIRYYETNQ